MSTFLQIVKGLRIKTKKAQVVSISILMVFIISQIIMPGGSFASGPRFNFLPGDYETLLLANATKGETNWHDPVNADYNDRISFNIYYHNGMEDTLAHNTKIRVDLPLTPSTHLISTAYLWADNAALITDTGTVNVNGSTPAQLEYLAGSTMWYPNQGSTPKPDPVHLPDGITQTGVNIGDITGCWEFSGFVVFQAKVLKQGQPQLTITKNVRNITVNENNFVKENSAWPGDELEYKVVISNPGNDTAENVNLRDLLPGKMDFIAGSLRVNGEAQGYNVFSDYVNIGSIAASDSTTILFKTRLDFTGFNVGQTCLENTAKTFADGIAIKNDSATTCVVVNIPDLTITKYVKNITKPDANYLKEGTAWPKDILEYKILFSNPGSDTAIDTQIKDVLPNYVSYVNDSTYLYELDNQTVHLPDTISNEGVGIGDIQPGEHGFILFRVKVNDCPPAGTHKLVNLAKIWAKNVLEKHDTAISILTVTPPLPPVLIIDKKVANITRGETTFSDANSAYANDVLQYRITFENVGKSQANNVVIKDELPGSVTFLSGSASAYIKGSAIALSDVIIGKGVNLPNLASHDSGYLTLKVKVKSNVKNGQKLINIAHIYADCNLHEQDSALTIVKKPIRIIIEKETLISTGTPIATILAISILAVIAIAYLAKRKKIQELNRDAIREARIAR
jgi:uncharacterized repeat protein (TIGR01451 family)